MTAAPLISNHISRWTTSSTVFLWLALFAPLVVLPQLLFPYVEGKYYFFRLCVEASLACYLVGAIRQRDAEQIFDAARNLASYVSPKCVITFVLIYLASCCFAADPNIAFWSTLERGDGGFQMIHYFVFFALLLLNLQERTDWAKTLLISALSAVTSAGYGLISALVVKGPNGVLINPFGIVGVYATTGGIAFPGQPLLTLLRGSRFEGSLGNADFAGVYFSFGIGFCILWALSLVKRTWRTWIAATSAAFVLAFALMLTRTRAVIAGFVAGVATVMVLLALRKVVARHSNARKYAVGAAVCGAAMCGAATIGALCVFTSFHSATNFDVANYVDSSAVQRLSLWRTALTGFFERPITGWGPENFASIFNTHFDPSLFQPNRLSETWEDRPHNAYLQYLCELGVFGLIAYLSIFFSVAVAAWQCLAPRNAFAFTNEQSGESLSVIVICGILVSYLVHGFFAFDTISSYVPLFVILGYATWLARASAALRSESSPSKFSTVSATVVKIALALVLIVTLVFGYEGNVLPFQKSVAFVRCRDSISLNPTSSSLSLAKNALSQPSPIGLPEYVSDFAWNVAAPMIDSADSTSSARSIIESVSSFTPQTLANPLAPQCCETRYLLAMLNRRAYDRTHEPAFLRTVKLHLERGLESSSDRPEFLFGLYDTYRLLHEDANAERISTAIQSRWNTEQRAAASSPKAQQHSEPESLPKHE